MGISEAFVVFLSYLAAFLATTLALVAWQRASLNWARPFAVMMLALAQWSLSLALELSSATAATMRIWHMMQIVGSSILPVAWFTFTARYSEHDRLISGNRRPLLYFIPIITMALAATNAAHGLLWNAWGNARGSTHLSPSYGPWYYLHIGYACLLLVAGALLLWRKWRQQGREQGWHLVAFTIGAATPVAGHLMQLLAEPADVQRVLPFMLLGAVVLLAWTVRHQQILETVLIARQMVLASMPDGVIVVNNQDRIIEMNPAAERLMQRSAATLLGQRFVEAAPRWHSLWYEAVVNGEVEAEMSLDVAGAPHWIDLRISPVMGRGGRMTGRIVVLRDITAHKEIENELTARRQLFEKLVAVARATAEDASLQATLQNALDVTAALTGAEYGSLFLLDSDGRVTHSILARGKTAPGSRTQIVGAVMNKGVAGWVLRHRRTALIHDTNEDDRWVTFEDQPYVARSVLVAPITSGSDVPGVLTLQHSQPAFFDEEDEALLRAASDQMALALHKAQLFEEQTQLANRQQTLYEALKTVGRHLEPGTVVHLATQTIARLTGWPAVGIFTATGDGAERRVAQMRLVAGSGLLNEQEGRLFYLTGHAANEPFTTGEQERQRPSNAYFAGADFPFLESTLVVPLQYARRQLGLLLLGSAEPLAFSADDVLLAESLAETVALAMTNAHLFQAVADEHGRLQALIEASRDGIILVSNEQRILFLNGMALTLLGLEHEPDAWFDCKLDQLFAAAGEGGLWKEYDATATAICEACAEPGDSDGELEVNKRVLRWQNLPVRSETATVGRLLVFEDVSKERSLQRMRNELTNTMVHDLRNPLNVVSGSLELLSMKAGDALHDDGHHLLDIAWQGVQRMLNLVNGILSISRLESGRFPLNLRSVNVKRLIADAITTQRPLALEKDQLLSHDFARMNGQSEPHVHADGEIVERILQNLLGNAIKFTPRGGSIVVRIEPAASDHMLLISVEDSGPGIPESIQDALFEKFVTGDLPERGSGLGLSFCRMAVEAHGGRISAENQETGARFSFSLPVAEP